MRDARDIVRNRAEGIDMDDANGDITKGGVVVATWMRGGTCWMPTVAWTSAISTPGQELESVLENLEADVSEATGAAWTTAARD